MNQAVSALKTVFDEIARTRMAGLPVSSGRGGR